MPLEFGRCDRELECSYFEYPKRHSAPKNANRIDMKIVEASCAGDLYYNKLFRFLITKFDEANVRRVFDLYKIGTSKYYDGGCVFWQIDRKGEVRTGKIMDYLPETGRRAKGEWTTTWVHRFPKLGGGDDYELEQCFFGEHLIDPNGKKLIHIYESEKTAIIAELSDPNNLNTHIACGNLNGMGGKSLNRAKCKAFKGHFVELHPDADEKGRCTDLWSNLADQMRDDNTTPAAVIDLNRYLIPAWRKEGWDMADVILAEIDGVFQNEDPDKLLYQPF